MKTKRTYLPANVRAGYTAQKLASRYPSQFASFKVEVDTFHHGHDVNGNGTAHYSAPCEPLKPVKGKSQ